MLNVDSAEKTPCFEKSLKIREMQSSRELSRIDCARSFWSDWTDWVVFSTVAF
jgi:hypothetical protein